MRATLQYLGEEVADKCNNDNNNDKGKMMSNICGKRL